MNGFRHLICGKFVNKSALMLEETTLNTPKILHDADQQRAVRGPSLEERPLNVVADSPESNTIVVAHNVSVIYETICRVLNENSLTHLPFSASIRFQPGRLSSVTASGGTVICAAAGLPSSCAEHL
ncbi:hypothetical protein TNCV_1798881 [Trichonephila clavipes]|uniref:Uncharacterized protein n=1 Tax=Trichonephila clavipes TaxID=2585209 RepID=A0A8X6SHU4_TRICX|nr:hypothetical protein TNCV_1798881 [Trichonephila clavipes]